MKNKLSDLEQTRIRKANVEERLEMAAEKDDAMLIESYVWFEEDFEEYYEHQRFSDLLHAISDRDFIILYRDEDFHAFDLYYFYENKINDYIVEEDLHGPVTIPYEIDIPDKKIEQDNPTVEDLLEIRGKKLVRDGLGFVDKEYDPDKFTMNSSNNLVSERYLDVFSSEQFDQIVDKLNLPDQNPLVETRPKLLTIQEIIKQGEDQRHEFKETFLYNTHSEEKDKDLKPEHVKEIAAMANTEGGTILFGINDESEITGLQRDYQHMDNRSDDRDSFRGQVIDITTELIGKKTTSRLVSVRFKQISGKDICIVRVQKSRKPVFYDDDNKFYIRAGSSKRKLDPKEFSEYEDEHFPDPPSPKKP